MVTANKEKISVNFFYILNSIVLWVIFFLEINRHIRSNKRLIFVNRAIRNLPSVNQSVECIYIYIQSELKFEANKFL